MAHVYPDRGFAGTPRVPTDAERLDWLERIVPQFYTYRSEGAIEVAFQLDDGARHEVKRHTLRAAIDAAMAIAGDIPPPAPAGPTEER